MNCADAISDWAASGLSYDFVCFCSRLLKTLVSAIGRKFLAH